MKFFLMFVMIFAAVSPVAMAQIGSGESVTSKFTTDTEKVEVAQYCNVLPRPAIRRLTTKATTGVLAPTQTVPAPTPEWPSTTTMLVGGMVFLGLIVSFLLGRLTAPNTAPQVVTPVVYVQPPPAPRQQG